MDLDSDYRSQGSRASVVSRKGEKPTFTDIHETKEVEFKSSYSKKPAKSKSKPQVELKSYNLGDNITTF